MFDGVREFTSTQPEDSAEFMKKVQALAIGVARDYEPSCLYVIRVDNWFGPKWMHFAGKVSVGKYFYAGIHTRILRSVRSKEAGFNHGLPTDCFYAEDERPTRTPPDRSVLRGPVGT